MFVWGNTGFKHTLALPWTKMFSSQTDSKHLYDREHTSEDANHCWVTGTKKSHNLATQKLLLLMPRRQNRHLHCHGNSELAAGFYLSPAFQLMSVQILANWHHEMQNLLLEVPVCRVNMNERANECPNNITGLLWNFTFKTKKKKKVMIFRQVLELWGALFLWFLSSRSAESQGI